jgi:hypothetical protein
MNSEDAIELAMEIGEVKGTLKSLVSQMSEVANDVKALRAREDTRAGEDAEKEKAERRRLAAVSIFSGGIGAGLVQLFHSIGQRFFGGH